MHHCIKLNKAHQQHKHYCVTVRVNKKNTTTTATAMHRQQQL